MISNFGASVTNLFTPDRDGALADIVLGYDNPYNYLSDRHYIGGVVGRFANRIAGGRVELDGNVYQLSVTGGGYHHHGGKTGFNKRIWTSEYIDCGDCPTVKMTYFSPDGEEGFPGNLTTTITYTLNDHNQLKVAYEAWCDKTTLLNLTQHSYFNLGGHESGSITGHKLFMPMRSYLPVNRMQVPAGEVAGVKNTPFDFTEAKELGERIMESNEQLLLSGGYDHSWVIKTSNSPELNFAAEVTEPFSGRRLRVYTTEPAIHLYTGNFLDGVPGKDSTIYQSRNGFCLETQQYPDAPNHSHFPTAVLEKDAIFKSETIFEFGLAI